MSVAVANTLDRIVVCHENPKTAASIMRAVISMGSDAEIAIESTNSAEAMKQKLLGDLSTSLVICGLTYGSKDLLATLLQVAEDRAIPAIIVAEEVSLGIVQAALEDHVMAFLTEPVTESQIVPTVHLVLKRFEEFENLRRDYQSLKESFEARRDIERAKAVIMRRSDVDETEAYERLRRLAMDGRMKMVDAAQKFWKSMRAIDRVDWTPVEHHG